VKTILVIDDNRLDRMIHRRWLEGAGDFCVLEAESADEGMALARATRVDCVIVDYMMLRENGLTAIRQMTAELPDCPPLLMVFCALTDDMRRNALALGASACFDKPVFNGSALVDAVRAAIADHPANKDAGQ